MELKRLISVTKTMFKGLITLLFFAGSTYATSLTSAVSFDGATQIYTYNYTLTNNTTFGVINQFYVGINSLSFSDFGPLSVTTPTGWEFHTGIAAHRMALANGCGTGRGMFIMDLIWAYPKVKV